MAAVNWTTTTVSAGASYSITSDDVIILAGSSSANTTITLPIITDGRVLLFKDKDGSAETNKIKIDVNNAADESIDGSNTSFDLNANYGAVVLVADTDSSKWYVGAIV